MIRSILTMTMGETFKLHQNLSSIAFSILQLPLTRNGFARKPSFCDDVKQELVPPH